MKGFAYGHDKEDIFLEYGYQFDSIKLTLVFDRMGFSSRAAMC